MPLLLPNLDDRRWTDLVEEARSLIPVYGPEWTDHNYHDPGITILELLAALVEMDIYELNQVPARHRLKFLRLVGIVPRPPQSATTELCFTLKAGESMQAVPAGVEFSGTDPFGQVTRFLTHEPVNVVAGQLAAIQTRDDKGFRDATPAWRRGDTISIFGVDPKPGAEIYVGLTDAFPLDTPVSIFFQFAGEHSGPVERQAILAEIEQAEKGCLPPVNPCAPEKKETHANQSEGNGTILLQHYGVRTVWEFFTTMAGNDQWVTLDQPKKQVEDRTRAFTLDGEVLFSVPMAMTATAKGPVKTPLYYLRCRFEAGAYDQAPQLRRVALNAVAVEQAVPVFSKLTLEKGATVTGSVAAGDQAQFRMKVDSAQKIIAIDFTGAAPQDPKFRVLRYAAPSVATPGELVLEGVFVAMSHGKPNWHWTLPECPLQQSSLRISTLEADGWRRWTLREDFDSSTAADSHFLLDPTSGTITFGDGRRGRVAPDQSLVFASYRTTKADGGNLAAQKVQTLADSLHNRVVLSDWAGTKANLVSITNPVPATGGLPAETLAHAEGRAVQELQSVTRALTLEDYEELVLGIPGLRVARVAAYANLHPAFPCFKAPGVVTVIVAPFLPQGKPYPSPALRVAVHSYLQRRRVIGTRIEITGPTYLEVAVQARVQSCPGTDKTALQQSIVNALGLFLDPLAGGPNGDGWPFGRDVYRSEIMNVIARIPGVDHIEGLDLFAAGCCEPQCGNVCLAQTWLTTPGKHLIQVL
ncbi:MAG: putative baseplate assembly protein [Acidobacteriia bacterium]|nr:putative baseplate assembly protein [Terriglobia bacterium]